MSKIGSPCVRNCCLDDDDICLGCFRSIQEIMQWNALDNDEKKQVLENSEQRRVHKANNWSV